MKATSLVLPVFGALLASAVALTGTPVLAQQVKPAVTGQAAKDAKAEKKETSKTGTKMAAKSTKASKKTVASRRVHHGKRQVKKSNATQTPKK